MVGWVLVWWGVAHADEVRGHLGGQIETEGNGIFDLGWRRGPLSVELFTDTLDVRLAQRHDWGTWSVGVRAAAFAAGMWITPWSNGAPDPDRAQRASYVGVDGRLQRNLGRGWWAGTAGFVRPHRFQPLGDATLRIAPRSWSQLQASGGLWRDGGRLVATATAGLDLVDEDTLSTHLHLAGAWRPSGTIAPLAEGRLGVAQGQDDLTATRLGGLTPYHVPFAGAAWAEFWVEDYAVARLGGRWSGEHLRLGAAIDVGAWTSPSVTTGDQREGASAVGGALLAEWRAEPWFLDLSVGYAPTLTRAEGIWPVPIYLLFGSDWSGLGPKRAGMSGSSR